MPRRQDDPAMPAIAGKQHKLVEQIARTRGNGQVDPPGLRHLRDLLRSTLMEMELDVRIARPELTDDWRQHVARLGMRSADGQRPAPLVLELRRDALDVL